MKHNDRVEFELQTVHIPQGMSRNAVRRLLAAEAEYNGWELSRSRIYRDGRRSVTLRRKIIRAARTADVLLPIR